MRSERSTMHSKAERYTSYNAGAMTKTSEHKLAGMTMCRAMSDGASSPEDKGERRIARDRAESVKKQ